MPSLKLFRRADDRPSLKDRAAALKARLSQITKRREAATDPHRRIMVAGGLAATIPLPAMAARAVTSPHPDQVVFDAEAVLLDTERAYYAARDAFNAANNAFWQALGPCPPELLLGEVDEDRGTFAWFSLSLQVRRDAPRFQFIRDVGEAWTAEGLRRARRNAVAAYGQGGRTPHRCRRYRALLPIAEAFDARRGELEKWFQIDALATANRAAERAWTTAQDALNATPAKTPAGLAVIARHVGQCSPERMAPNWRNLLVSAANVSGVDLNEPAEPRRPIHFG